MVAMIMFILSLLIIAMMIAVIWLDVTRFVIPNWLVALLLVLYPLYVVLSPQEIGWAGALGVAVIAFAIGLLLFATKIMGGGDVKLLVVCCLWVGIPAIITFLLYTSLLGGALALLLLLGRPSLGYFWANTFPDRLIPRLFKKGEPAPYGVAIAGAMIILVLQFKITGLGLELS